MSQNFHLQGGHKKTDNPEKFRKEFNSFSKKFINTKHEIWFFSLSNSRQWDLLFGWKKFKFYQKKKNSTPSFKKFVYFMKTNRKFWVSKQKLREATLNKII